jgi:signal transduction histidine kinase
MVDSETPPAHVTDERLDEIMDVLQALVRQDFSRSVPIRGTGTLDAIATGINILVEELERSVASRRDLEAAYEELRLAEARLVQADKMAAIGLLASGVAHEVNNPAAWVSLALGMIKRSVERMRRLADEIAPASPITDELRVIEPLLTDCTDGIKRVIDVVGDLLVFSRSDDGSFEPIAFDEVISSSWRMASTTVVGEQSLVVDLGETPTFIANRGRVAQVVLNLLLNAAHAVRRTPAPRIVVSTRAHDDGVLLAVEDSGPGIPEDIRARVFDPFFTTKPGQEGTGLGLTMVAQIASSYGGWARVARPLGGLGARLEVWFPCRPRLPTLTSAGLAKDSDTTG